MRGIFRALITPLAMAALLFGQVCAQNTFASGGMTMEDVATIFRGHSFSAKITGDKEISAKAWGYEFAVNGANCSGGNRCTEFLLTIGFDLPNGYPLERINLWNARELAGRAYLDEDGDPFLDHVISVHSASDTGAFYEGLLLWLNALEDFDDFLDETELSS